MKYNILLIGGRSKAKSLAISLLNKGYTVTAVNKTYEDCLKLSEISHLTVIHGDGTKPFVLDEADAKHIDIAIALTNKDEDNLVACELCKKLFHVPKTMTILSDLQKIDFFHAMGIDSVICATDMVTHMIEREAFVGKIAAMLPLAGGHVNLAEVPITSTSPVVNKKLKDINLPKYVIIGCILRGTDTKVPRGDTTILSGDTLLLISSNNQETKAIRELRGF